MNAKKGYLVSIMLSLIVLLAMMFILPSMASGGTKGIFEFTNNLFAKKNIEPKGMNSTEISESSIKALVLALNSAANLQSIYSDKNQMQDADEFPKEYKITYYSKIELKEDDDGNSETREKEFSKRFPVEGETYLYEERLVFADYNLDDEKAKDYADYYNRTKEAYPKIKNQAPIKQVRTVYNIMLEARYADGKTCIASTIDEGEGQAVYDSMNDASISSSAKDAYSNVFDLAVWGSWGNNCATLDECDKNDNGVPGKFLDNHLSQNSHKKASETLSSSMWKEVQKYGLSQRFPQGTIDVNSEEGCLDSPTWMECPGIRVYYCGKTGYQSGQSKIREDKDYFLSDGDDIHSRSAIKILRVFDKSYDGILTKEKEDFIKHSNGKIIEGNKGFAAVERDAILRFFLDMAEHAYKKTSSAQEKLADPRISCDAGREYGNSKLKCDLYGCNLCNFELTQEYINNAKMWVSGNLDPQYILYYQAFPLRDEQAWIGGLLKMNEKNHLKIPPSSPTRTDQQYALDIIEFLEQNIDFSEKKLKNQYNVGEVFARAKAVLMYADKDDSKVLFDKAQRIASILILDSELMRSAEQIIKEDTKALSASYAAEWYGKFKEEFSQQELVLPYAASLFFLAREELDKKTYPQGNDLFIKSPFQDAYSTADKASEWNLALSQAGKYYIQLAKTGGAERFYLASPCKADLKILKTRCDCFIPKDGSIMLLKSNGAEIPVIASSVSDDNSRYITYCISPRSARPEELNDKENKVISIDCLEVQSFIGSNMNSFCYNPQASNWNVQDKEATSTGSWPNH